MGRKRPPGVLQVVPQEAYVECDAGGEDCLWACWCGARGTAATFDDAQAAVLAHAQDDHGASRIELHDEGEFD